MWKKIHDELGCSECRFCNHNVLYKKACCTFLGSIKLEESGKCLMQRPRDLDRHMNFSYVKERSSQLQQKFNETLSKKNGIDIYKAVDNLADIGNFFNIYYRRRPTFRPNPAFMESDAIMDDILSRRYVKVVHFWGKKDLTLENIFFLMQGEVWSPEGEARELIGLIGLHHTSMSVGDLIENSTNDAMIYEVAGIGFNNLSCGLKTEIKTTNLGRILSAISSMV